MSLAGKHILMIVTGGIAAYKALETIRFIQKAGGSVQVVMTRAATEFVTPLSAATLSGRPVLTELFDLTQETEIGHIELSRSANLIVVAPASADFLARMAHGLANDLAATTVLATDTAILAAPAMNVRMWEAPATRRNLDLLAGDGVTFVGPDEGDMACGEYGPGRMAEPAAILEAIAAHFAPDDPKLLEGRHVIVTSGPTREPIDPVRYISNASSGRQGAAIGAALVALGARVTFVTGPAETPPPAGCEVVRVETAREMRDAVMAALPADAAVSCAAVADWYVANAATAKLKKTESGSTPALEFAPNPDILAEVAGLKAGRPALVVGFAAETSDIEEHAWQKLARKKCDWLLANDVSKGTGTFGGADNAIIFLTEGGKEAWGRLSKTEVGHKLADRIAGHLTRS